MAEPVVMKQFRVVALDYRLQEDFSGRINIKPEITFAVPENRVKPLVRCRYKLDISCEDNDSFSLSLTGEGIFELKELPAEIAPGILDQSGIDPIIPFMEEKLIEAVEKITADFGIPPMKLEIAQKEA